jgi:hypothetical protein
VNPATSSTVFRARQSRRAAIETFFLEHLGGRFSTMLLHEQFGTSFRARVSEINRSPSSKIRILNKTTAGNDASGQPCERSVYWAERQSRHDAATETDFMRRRREEQTRSAPLFAGVRP